jgi:hypothetical protein
MKKCSGCKIEKSLDEFQKRAKNRDGHTGICKSCKRQYDNSHYKTHPERRTYIRTNATKQQELVRQYVLEYLLKHPCIDCGNSNLLVLEFDHLDNKDHNVSALMRGYALEKVINEISKCEVRCANCHRIKTARTLGSWRLQYHAPIV